MRDSTHLTLFPYGDVMTGRIDQILPYPGEPELAERFVTSAETYRTLAETAHGRIDIVHGHSSHHPKAIGIHEGKPILYRCDDFLNDYEGISGCEDYRSDVTLMYLPAVDPSDGRLVALTLVPFLIRRFRLQRASRDDVLWLADRMNGQRPCFISPVELSDGNELRLCLRGAA